MAGRGLPYHGRGRGRGDFQGSPRGGRGGYGGGRGASNEVEIFSPGILPQQNIQVQKIENDTENANKSKSTAESTNTGFEQHLPLRPGYGTQGKQVLLWANYFEVAAPQQLQLFRYSIDVLPDVPGRTPAGRKLQRIIELLLEENFAAYHVSIATDHKSNLVCKVELPIQEHAYHIRYRSEKEDEPSQNAETYRIRLRDSGTLTAGDLLDHLASTNASAMLGSKAQTIQALNIVMGQYPKVMPNFFSVGSNKHFDVSSAGVQAMSLGSGLTAVRGFFISVRAATSRLLVNVQVKHVACYNAGRLDWLMTMYLNENGDNMMKLGAFLKKLRVQVTHIIRKNKNDEEIPRMKTITSLAMPGDGDELEHPPVVPKFGAGAKEVKFYIGTPGANPQDTKQLPVKQSKKGTKPSKVGPTSPQVGYTTVYDFFHRNYNVTVQNPHLPVVNVGSRAAPSYLPADVCSVLSGQSFAAKLSPSQTQQMIRFAVRKPAQNCQSIVTSGAGVLGVGPSVNGILDEFGINVQPGLITVPGRVLKGPDVKYRDGKAASTRFGSWNMQSIQFTTRARLTSWTYLWLSLPGSRDAWRDQKELESSTMKNFQAKLNEVGMEVGPFTPGLKVTLRPGNIDMDIDAAIKRFVSHATRKPPALLLVILPGEDATIYNSIKLACDVKFGVCNVCVIASKFAKERNDQYFANVGLKFNLKLGGRNQVLDKSKLGVLAEGKTMVVGIDVTHPSPGSAKNTPSVAGIVASIDQWLGQWPADLRIQTARQEMVAGLDDMVKSRLRLWAKNNRGAYPDNLLIYRDGVSEGQYNIVLDQELPLLRKACKDIYPADDTKKGLPRMSIIVVGKRHNTRFYPTKKEDADRSSNPQNGTVVDRGVTEAGNWDFFLQAHTALQGTARPAHYYIILDEIFRTRKPTPPFKNVADALEDLTHNMCYLQGRATKAVSICPPAYYADLLCTRARCYLSGLFDPSPGATPAGSVSDGGQNTPGGSTTVHVHEDLRDIMFYI